MAQETTWDRTYPKPAGRNPELSRRWSPRYSTTGTPTTPSGQASTRREGAPEYVFYDGPPFANGLPHYGHLLTGYVKDIVPRYRTMRGYQVERRFGWDTHGLPAELEVQRQLGITDKAQIEEMGIEKFNDACRDSVLKYTDEWRAYVTRQARWVDFDNDYKTLDPTFMESVIWAFKQLWDKGLAYEGVRVLPYCWNDETPLSSHELRMDDDVYQSRQDPAITVGFQIAEGPLAGAHLLVWTTTPWTLPSNQAVAVNPEVTYVEVAGPDGERYVLAQARLAAYARELGDEPQILATYTGAALLGMRYLPPFPYFMDSPNAFQVLRGDFVTTEDGTGIVHMAPAYGEDDKTTTDTVGIVAGHAGRLQGSLRRVGSGLSGSARLRRQPADHPRPEEPLRSRAGQRRGADAPRDLRALLPALLALPKPVDLPGGVVVVRQGHRVPGPDGRTQPADHLVSRARQGRPVRQVAGQAPGTGRSPGTATGAARFRCGSPMIRRTRGSTYTAASTNWSATSGCVRHDLHRPYIDELTRPNPDDPTGKSTMRRIEDVLDVWFDSGSMPYRPGALPVRERRMVRRCRRRRPR